MIDDFRRQVRSIFENRCQALTNAVVQVRASGYETVDKLALQQVENLSEARAYYAAIEVLEEVFKKMTRPAEQPPDESSPTPLQTEGRRLY